MFVNGVESDSLEVNSAVPQGSILSFTHGIFPDNLKIAQVIPLVKQRSSSSCSNYRDLFAITETWLTDDSLDEFYCRDICPEGYNIEQLPRNYADGGGVALVYRRCFKVKRDVQMIHKSFELINIIILGLSLFTELHLVLGMDSRSECFWRSLVLFWRDLFRLLMPC